MPHTGQFEIVSLLGEIVQLNETLPQSSRWDVPTIGGKKERDTWEVKFDDIEGPGVSRKYITAMKLYFREASISTRNWRSIICTEIISQGEEYADALLGPYISNIWSQKYPCFCR